MISHKLIPVVLFLAAIASANTATADFSYSGTISSWNLSMNVDNVFRQINQNSIKGSNTNEFVIVNKNNLKEQATIYLKSLDKTQAFDNNSMLGVLKTKSSNLSKVSFEPEKIAGTNGMVGKGYDNNSGSWVYLAYFPVWPSDSTSDRAVLIVSTLAEKLSNQLFDTIQVKHCPGRKPPLGIFSSAQDRRSPHQLSTQNKSSPVRLGQDESWWQYWK
jgi:hypothetical protein